MWSQGRRVVSNNWSDRALLPIIHVLKPSRWPMFNNNNNNNVINDDNDNDDNDNIINDNNNNSNDNNNNSNTNNNSNNNNDTNKINDNDNNTTNNNSSSNNNNVRNSRKIIMIVIMFGPMSNNYPICSVHISNNIINKTQTRHSRNKVSESKGSVKKSTSECPASQSNALADVRAPFLGTPISSL